MSAFPLRIPRNRRTALAPFVFLLVFAAVLLWPLMKGQALYWGDILLYFAPMYSFGGHTLREGIVPLWNPYLLCGQPFHGNPQISLFYPTSLLLPFVPTWTFISIVSYLHLSLCGVFTYLYLQRWTTWRSSALAGACIYMGSAYILGRLQFPPMLQTVAYFPALLWRMDRYIDKPCTLAGILLACIVCLTLLAAHAQVAYLIFLCGALYGLRRIWDNVGTGSHHNRKFAATLRLSLPLLSLSLLGLLLSSVQTLPSLQLLTLSSRAHLDPWETNRFSLEPQHLLTLFAPRFLGHPASADYWGGKTAWEPAIFVGWVPLVWIASLLLRRQTDRIIRFWGVLMGMSIWLAFGVWGGLYWIAYYLLPGLKHFHDPARFLLWTTFSCSVLAAYGMDRWKPKAASRWKFFPHAAILSITVPLWFYGRDWNPTTKPAYLTTTQSQDRVENDFAGTHHTNRTYYPLHMQPWKRFVTEGYGDFGDNGAETLRAWTSAAMPNSPMQAQREFFPGYEPVPIEAVTEMDGLARNAWSRGEPNFVRLTSLVDVDTVLVPISKQGVLPGVEDIQARPSSGVRFQPLIHKPDFAWLTRKVQKVEGVKRVIAALSNPDFSAQETTLVSGITHREDRLLQPLIGESGEVTAGQITWHASAHHTIDIDVDAGTKPAFLTLSSAAYPGWTFDVNKISLPPIRANGGLIGTVLPPGRHLIRFHYAPFVYRFGLYLTLAAFGIMTGMGCFHCFASIARQKREETA